MLRFDSIVFGPIKSRRLGSSLGINLLPRDGKICSFDCIYCEIGWNADGRTNERMPSASEVRSALEAKLVSCQEGNVGIDAITFSGQGEPTLHHEFERIVDDTIELRNKYYPDAKVTVLSNATMLHQESVVEALKKVDYPVLKLDAPTDASLFAMNRPCGGSAGMVDRIVAGLKKFDGNFILQTMFLKGACPDYENEPELLSSWMDIVRVLRPRKIMVYTLDRPAPQAGLGKMPAEVMRKLLEPLFEEGFDIQIKG